MRLIINNSLKFLIFISLILTQFGCQGTFDAIDTPLKKIAFKSNRGGDTDIYLMNEDGSDIIRLTNEQNIIRNYQFVPDGSKIIYISGEDIYSITLDGKNRLNLTENFPYTPSFMDLSPDGSTIVCTAQTNDWQIYTIALEDGKYENITANTDFKFSPHAVYTNGVQILLEISVRDSMNNRADDIFLMRLDAKQMINLTGDLPNLAESPQFSSDHSYISFLYRGQIMHDIYVIDAIDYSFKGSVSTYYNYPHVHFKPDGSKIIYTYFDNSDSEIALANIDGSNQVILTNNDIQDHSAVFSKDGSKIIYVSGDHFDSEVYSMNFDGSNKKNLTNNSAGDWEPKFQPR